MWLACEGRAWGACMVVVHCVGVSWRVFFVLFSCGPVELMLRVDSLRS